MNYASRQLYAIIILRRWFTAVVYLVLIEFQSSCNLARMQVCKHSVGKCVLFVSAYLQHCGRFRH